MGLDWIGWDPSTPDWDYYKSTASGANKKETWPLDNTAKLKSTAPMLATARASVSAPTFRFTIHNFSGEKSSHLFELAVGNPETLQCGVLARLVQ